jgi:S-adenosylmethionine decarboxylase proenzyme
MHLISALSWETISQLMANSVIALGAIHLAGAEAIGLNETVAEDDDAMISQPSKKGLLQRLGQESQVDMSLEHLADDLSPREYAFHGRHLLASYTGCSESALHDFAGLTAALHEAVAASGATLLDSVQHIFPPHGMTAVVLLSESHASIHTYPEHRSCFVDIFTCGTTCQVEAFDATLRNFLKPERAERRIIDRHDDMLDEESGHAAT